LILACKTCFVKKKKWTRQGARNSFLKSDRKTNIPSDKTF